MPNRIFFDFVMMWPLYVVSAIVKPVESRPAQHALRDSAGGALFFKLLIVCKKPPAANCGASRTEKTEQASEDLP